MDFDTTPLGDENLPTLLARLRLQFHQDDTAQRRAAVQRLYELACEHGETVADALPVLLVALEDQDDDIGESASWALKYLAPTSVSPLVKALAHPWAAVRQRAAQALGNAHDEAVDAVPALRQLLNDADVDVSCRAAWALGLIGEASTATQEPLWRLVAEGATRQRGAVLHALGNLGRRLDESAGWPAHRRPLVLAALEDADDDVRWSALYAAEYLRLPASEWIELLAGLLRSETSDRVIDAVMGHLKTLAAAADLSALMPELIRRLAVSGPRAARICDVLGAMRPPALQALPALHQAMATDDMALRAARAIWRIQPDTLVLMPVLDRLFDDHDEEICDLICEMGPVAAPLLPRLLAVLGGDNWDAQWAAVDALAAIAPVDSEARSALLTALGHDSPLVRAGAARALARSGADAVDALRLLVRAPADCRSAWAAHALGLMGNVAAGGLRELRAGMHSADQALAGACQIALARIGSGESLHLLIDMLGNPEAGGQRAAAAEALGVLGPAARPAWDALEALAHDDDAGVAEAALVALERIDGALH